MLRQDTSIVGLQYLINILLSDNWNVKIHSAVSAVVHDMSALFDYLIVVGSVSSVRCRINC